MPEELSSCPACHSSLRVFPVSRIYIAAITAPRDRSPADRQVLRAVFDAECDLAERLEPFLPPGELADRPRPVHPDSAAAIGGVIFFVLGVNLYANYHQVPLVFWVALGLALALFGLLRAKLLGSYRAQLKKQEADRKTIAEQIEAWQRRFYCVDDGCIFVVSGQENDRFELAGPRPEANR